MNRRRPLPCRTFPLLASTPDAADRRVEVGAILGIGYGNAKQFLKRLNHYGVTRDEWDDALRQIHEVK